MHHVWVTNFVGLVNCGLPPRTALAGAMRACLLRRGESKIRRYVLEHDLLEALIALPEQIFYNTGIATYVWVLTNRKASARKGKVQLIDATSFWAPMGKSLGDKRRDLPLEREQDIPALLDTFADGESTMVVKDGNPEADPELRDTESVPLPSGDDPVDEDGVSASVRAFSEREVKPHVPDAWIDLSKRDSRDGLVGVVGYEINFNRYFYRYTPPRPLEKIEADIREIGADIVRMLGEITESAVA